MTTKRITNFDHFITTFRCKGGSTLKTWRYLKHVGVVTGGDYGSDEVPNSLQFTEPFIRNFKC